MTPQLSNPTSPSFSVLTVQGSVYTQNPKYGIYAIDGTYNDRAVYKQAWPSKNNFLYYKNGKYIIRFDLTSTINIIINDTSAMTLAPT